MKRMIAVALGALATVAPAETVNVPAGETKTVCGRDFKGETLVKDGPGELVLKGVKLRNEGMDIRNGTVSVLPADRGNGEALAITARYLRFNVTRTRPGKSGYPEYANSGSQFSEFRLFYKGKKLDLAKARAMNQNSAGNKAEGPAMGIDGNVKTKCFFNPMIVDLGEETTFDGYSYVTANDAIGRDPIAWKLEVGTAKAGGISWMFVGAVESFDPPRERFAEVGKIFPLVVSGLIPYDYPIAIGGLGRLVVKEDTCLGRCSGDGLIQVNGKAELVVDGDSTFSGSVAGGGKVTIK